MISGKILYLVLCGICDILEPLITVLVESQIISLPCWKILVWWPALKNYLEEIRLGLKSKCYDFLPLLVTNLGDLKKMKFKDVSLVERWMEVFSETIEGSESGKQTLVSWKARNSKDSMRDLIAFVTDMISSFNGKIQKCTKKWWMFSHVLIWIHVWLTFCLTHINLHKIIRKCTFFIRISKCWIKAGCY